MFVSENCECIMHHHDGFVLSRSLSTINNHTRSNAMNQRTSDSECDDSRIRVRVVMNVIARVSLLFSFR